MKKNVKSTVQKIKNSMFFFANADSVKKLQCISILNAFGVSVFIVFAPCATEQVCQASKRISPGGFHMGFLPLNKYPNGFMEDT